MITLYLDTEFNGFGGALISMALVSDEGVEFEGVIDPWVHENVIPKIGRPSIPQSLFRNALHSFMRQFDNPLVVCDWHADLMHFFASFAGENYENSMNYKCRTLLLDSGVGDWPNPMPHNALCDARVLRDWHISQRGA